MAGTVISPDEFGITGNETIEQQVKILRDRVFMLLEQLKYLLANLGEDNFNETELKKITEPIYAQITDTEGKLAELVLNAEGLSLTMSNLEQGIARFEMTTQGLVLNVGDLGRGMASLAFSVDGLVSSVSNLDGKVSTVKQTVDGLQITTQGGTSYISGDHIRSGTIEGVTIISEGAGVNDGNVVIENGQLLVYPAGATGGLPVAMLKYDYDSGRVVFGSDYFYPLKIASSADMAIDANLNRTIYIGTVNRQRIMLGNSVDRNSTVEIYGNIYINGESLASYIARIAKS